MSGLGLLLILILISSIPAIAVFMWFHAARYPFSLARFSASLLAGAASLFPALFFQKLLGSGIFRVFGRWEIVAEIFIRIAFTEELSRLLLLLPLFFIFRRFGQAAQPEQYSGVPETGAPVMAGAAGLIAGLGFAILESAVYGAANPGNVLLRAFTAAPLHGACGFRIGSSAAIFKTNPAQAFSRFLGAVLIHGAYNFMIVIPGALTPIAAILLALSGFATAVLGIRTGMREAFINQD